MRDEGVSHHYLPPALWARPTSALSDRLHRCLDHAALFTVARVRGVEVAATFAISDSLADGEWVPQFGRLRLAERMVPAAVSALDDDS